MTLEKALIISSILDRLSDEVLPSAEEDPEGRVFLMFENQQQFGNFFYK